VIEGLSVYETRKRIGAELAREVPIDVDLVVPVPDSGVPSAIGYAHEAGIPYEMGIIRTGFAEIFFDDVRVSVDNRLGDEGAGWQIAMATAGFERGLMLRSPARFQQATRRLVSLYRQHHGDLMDPAVEDDVLRCYMDAEAYALSTYQTASRLLQGGSIGPEASCNKIFWSELDLRIHDTAMRILGARAEVEPSGSSDQEDLGTWLDGFLFAQSGPIYAGTNEIQRNIIAERVLGMPRR